MVSKVVRQRSVSVAPHVASNRLDHVDADGIEEDDNAPALILRLSGNKRLHSQPEADTNKLMLLCNQWDKCKPEEKEILLPQLASKVLDMDTNKRLHVIVTNARLMKTIASLLNMEWMSGNPSWLMYTRLHFLATHTEGVSCLLPLTRVNRSDSD